jgi:hypothetical protein
MGMENAAWELFARTGLPVCYLLYKEAQSQKTKEQEKHEHQRTDYPGNGFRGI